MRVTSSILILMSCAISFQGHTRPVVDLPGQQTYINEWHTNEWRSFEWHDTNPEYLKGWKYQYDHVLLPGLGYHAAINFAPQVSGQQEIFEELYHPVFYNLIGHLVGINFFRANNTGPYTGIANLQNGTLSAPVWQHRNSSFFGQSATSDFTIYGYYSELRPLSPDGEKVKVNLLPYRAEKQGDKYELIEEPLPKKIKNAGVELHGKYFSLIQTGVYQGIYKWRTLSVVNNRTQEIIESMSVIDPFTYFVSGQRVLLRGLAMDPNPTQPSSPTRIFEEKYPDQVHLKKLSSDEFIGLESIGVPTVSVLCDLDRSDQNPCDPTPTFTTGSQYFAGLDTANNAYVLADGSHSPACLYKAPFNSKAVSPPNSSNGCALPTPVSANLILQVKVSDDGHLATMNAFDNKTEEYLIWLFTRFDSATHDSPDNAVQLLNAVPLLAALLKDYKGVVIDILAAQAGEYKILGHNNLTEFQLTLAPENEDE